LRDVSVGIDVSGVVVAVDGIESGVVDGIVISIFGAVDGIESGDVMVM
jgi:hypothetical protein